MGAYIDPDELLPCKTCGLKSKYIQQRNSSAIISLRCPCCAKGYTGNSWEELKEKWNKDNERGPITEVCTDSIFHVHTYRCKHASEESDEAYIRKAIELGAKRIMFTDHAPFPGNPFRNRMDYEQLPEYISTLKKLRNKYLKRINVQIGLEIEYLPSFNDYYQELVANEDLEWLILGQHMFEYEHGVYSFSDTNEVKKQTEYIGLCEAMIEGMKTGFFRVCAHPDRAFRRRKVWDNDMEELSIRIIKKAIETGTILEDNISSYKRKHQHWDQFWDTLYDRAVYGKDSDNVFVIKGLDAHSTEELEKFYNMQTRYNWRGLSL